MYYSNIDTYFYELSNFIAWCNTMEYDLQIRCRPNETIFFKLAENNFIDINQITHNTQIPISQFADNSIDICVFFDSPSSASIEFLNKGIPVFLLKTKTFSDFENAQINKTIISCKINSELQILIKSLLNDNTLYNKFKLKKFYDYIKLTKKSPTLEDFIYNNVLSEIS